MKESKHRGMESTWRHVHANHANHRPLRYSCQGGCWDRYSYRHVMTSKYKCLQHYKDHWELLSPLRFYWGSGIQKEWGRGCFLSPSSKISSPPCRDPLPTRVYHSFSSPSGVGTHEWRSRSRDGLGLRLRFSQDGLSVGYPLRPPPLSLGLLRGLVEQETLPRPLPETRRAELKPLTRSRP